ncbi:MAG TPA: HAMP domain-containing sensor histidine kinase [Acidimicrobiales bacterium]|nr:HAMP domain-containing sensor histidine kinase [Acidimicrobiales bacterium]
MRTDRAAKTGPGQPAPLDAARRAELAEERLRHQTLLFAEAEHKLKTSLAIISGWASTLDDRWEVLSPEQRRDGISTIRRSADTLAEQTRRLLEDAKVEMARLDLTRVELDLAEILRATTRAYDAVSSAHAIRADIVGPVRIVADPAGLQQVLGHLVDNAVKYSPDGGVVRLGARAVDERWAELTVSDEGIGIPEGIDLFAAFSQGPSAAGHRGGVGLGLYIVHNLVEGMGGTVHATRNRDSGSTFTVRLPAVGR